MSKLLRSILFGVCVLVGTGITIGPAQGHAGLLYSTPEDGATLEIAPADIRLTFNEELFAELIEVSVLNDAGDLVMVTEAEQTPPPGTDVIVPWPADLPPGQYSVAFRVVSADGHPVTGQITFSYDSVAEPALEETVEETVQETPDPTPELIGESVDESTTEDPATSQEIGESREPVEPASSPVSPVLIGLGIVIGIGVVASIIIFARRRN